MRKNFLKILIISVLCAIVSFALCFTSVFTYESESRTGQLLDEIQAEEEIDDVEGYGYIVEGAASVLVDIGEAVAVLVFLILIPGVFALLMLLLQLISGVMQIGKTKLWKMTTAKICTYISLVLEMVFTLYVGMFLFSNLSVNIILLLITFILNLICSVVFVIEVKNIKRMGEFQ